MPIETKLYRVFIASPRDVSEERDIVREQIDRWNAIHAVGMEMVLLPVGWETDATPDLQERGQEVINRQLVDHSDLLIGIFWTRLGTPTTQAVSGTWEEIERAFGAGKRCIVYFSDRATEPSKIDQREYKRLQKKRQEFKGLFDSYKTLDEFKEKVFRHITSAVLEIAKEDRDRRAAEQEARLAEQAIGLSTQPVQRPTNPEIGFETLLEAQASVRQLLESQFGLQDMENVKEKEIANIQTVLNSPELAALLSQQPNVETVSTIAQILEVATTPSMYAIAALCKYGNDSLIDWLDLTGDWVERLSTRKIEGGYEWASYVKTYPGLLLLYALGISALRTAKTNFLKEATERQIYSREYDREFSLLDRVEPRYVLYHDIGKLIEPGFARNFTPVSDHLAPLIKSKLYPNEEETRYLEWFDLFEFLISLKSVQLGKEHPYFGSFTWRTETQRMIIRSIQDAAIEQGKNGIAISKFFNGKTALKRAAEIYDGIVSQVNWDFGRASAPSYISLLIELSETGKRVGSYRELATIIASLRQASK